MKQIQSLRQRAEYLDAEVKGLEARYGTGIRPGWVGEEIAILHQRAKLAREEADEKEAALANNQPL